MKGRITVSMTDYAFYPWEDEAGERYENSQDGAKCELLERKGGP